MVTDHSKDEAGALALRLSIDTHPHGRCACQLKNFGHQCTTLFSCFSAHKLQVPSLLQLTPPNDPTYTVLVLDILLKEYRKACIFFRKLTNLGLPRQRRSGPAPQDLL